MVCALKCMVNLVRQDEIHSSLLVSSKRLGSCSCRGSLRQPVLMQDTLRRLRGYTLRALRPYGPYLYLYICMYISVYIYICIYVRIYIYVCTYADAEGGDSQLWYFTRHSWKVANRA